jgi:hypothetical protein
MPTYLNIHRARTDSHQRQFRSRYELRHMDYELNREVNHRGELISEATGGKIRVVIDGFGDDDLFHWLFRPDIEENGEIVTMDLRERVIEKFLFYKAKATSYRLHFDANTKNAVSAVVVIDAKEIETDNNLFYKRKKR